MTLNATSTGLAGHWTWKADPETVAGLFSTGNVANDKVINNGTTGAGTLTISLSGNAIFGGVIIPGTSTGANAVTKAGTGMQTLAGRTRHLRRYDDHQRWDIVGHGVRCFRPER